MKGEVRSPIVFGQPLWSWASLLVHGSSWRCVAARRILWPLCLRLTGHRQAAGERGYGGGGQIDVICAYCHFTWQIPAAEMPSASHLVDLFHGPTP